MNNKLKQLALGLATAVTIGLASIGVAQADQVITDVFDDRWFGTLHLGVILSDDEDLDSGESFGLSLGKPLSEKWAIEATFSYENLAVSCDPPGCLSGETDYERMSLSGQFLYFFNDTPFRDTSTRTHFFGLLGVQGASVDFLGESLHGFGPVAGLGFLHEFDVVNFRAEARYKLDDIDGSGVVPDETFYTWSAWVGLSVPFGQKPLPPSYDDDGDGVPNNRDKCPNTPPGVKVGPDGCPLDSDGDGVPDSYDKCPNTPAGVKVDADGCPLDSDGDGIPDSIDKCPDTPLGTIVNSDGCPLDSDGDGVPDGIDQCPDTLPGMQVNSKGCVVPQVFELRGVHFEYDKSRLMIDSKVILDRVVESLQNEPTVKIMIAGHTDWMGSDAYNQKLSERRAASVVDYLVSKGIPASRLSAKGFGETQPVATNETADGREHNRRTELHILEDGYVAPESEPAMDSMSDNDSGLAPAGGF